jgi:hypothetical protein
MIVDPVFIIGCARSGTTLLFSVLSESPELFSIGYEGGAIWERHHHPSRKNWRDGALDAADVTAESRRAILREFERGAASGRVWRCTDTARAVIRDNALWRRVKGGKGALNVSTTARAANRFQHLSLNSVRALVRLVNDVKGALGFERRIRLLEKTPENCLRIPFLREIFPDAKFVYLTRDGRANTHSLIESWKHFRLEAGYLVPEALHIQGYTGRTWKFTLIPGWTELKDSPLEVVCAHQWVACNQAVLAQRPALEAAKRMITVRYEDLVSEPMSVLPQICDFVGIDATPFAGSVQGLPEVNLVSKPGQDKWRRENPEAIARVLPLLQSTMRLLGYENESSNPAMGSGKDDQ